jgi:hypothetical protein
MNNQVRHIVTDDIRDPVWISVKDSAWYSIWGSVRGSVVYSAWDITKFSRVNSVNFSVINSAKDYFKQNEY